jgi:long-chain-fatty-acid---luciferin-component ligase
MVSLKWKDNGLRMLEYSQLNLSTIFTNEELYQQIQTDMIKEAFIYHVNHNKGYSDYCKVAYCSGDWPYRDFFSVSSIPLLPSTLFKRKNINLATCTDDAIIKYCTSSGTKGSLSIVPRDEETLVNFLGSISASISCLFEIERSGNHQVFILGPNPDESGDLWFSYVLSTMALSIHTEYFEEDGYFDLAAAINAIQSAAENENMDLLIIGPPFRMVQMCEYMNDNNIKIALNKKSYLISAGGWKDKNNIAIARDKYNTLICRQFQIGVENVRDSFNMVEFNSVFCECNYNEKHVLPWTDVCALNPHNHQVLPEGQVGILAFYDGSSYSYPCFILSEDYGMVHSGRCSCGRVGKRIAIVRRMEGIEARGCALKMAADIPIKNNHKTKHRYYKSYYRVPELYQNSLLLHNQIETDNPTWWMPDKAFYNYVFTPETMKEITPDADADKEVRGVINLLNLKPGNKLLDCPCGFGRHSNLLAANKMDVLGIDINQKFLDYGMARAHESGLTVTYKKLNMLELQGQNEFDTILNMYSSFGYFATDEQNFSVLVNFYQILKIGGKLLIHLDTPLLQIESRGFDALKWNGAEWGMTNTLHSNETQNETWIIDNYSKKTKRLEGRIKVTGALNQTETYSTRIYAIDEWRDMLKRVGFSVVNFYEDWEKTIYRESSKIMIVVAQK